MKRNFRRFANIATATLMAACMTAPMASGLTSSAAKANTITITGQGDEVAHTYTLYQLFAGDVTTANISTPNTLGAMSNISWADGVDSAAFMTAIDGAGLTGWTKPDDATAPAYAKAIDDWAGSDASRAKELAQFLGKNVDKLAKISESTTNSFECSADGYYIIVETTLGAVDGSMTYHLLGTYDAETGADISVKASKPSVVKKVKENVKYTADDGYGAGYNDVADYTLGDMVPFRLIATLPSNIDVYNNYYIKYTDALEAGFVAPTKVTVTIDGATGTSFDVAIDETSGEGTADAGNIKVTVTDNGTTGITITVEVFNVQKYKPESGSLSATTVTVDYEAKFDTDAQIGLPGNYNDVYLTYSNNPNNTGDGTTAPTDTGETDKDGVVVFTYELDVHKYDGADTDKALLAGADFVLSNEDGEYLCIDDSGVYSWTEVTGVTDPATFDWSTTGVEIFTSTAIEVIKIPGLDDGTYTLTEIKAPTGFNITAPLTLKVSATTTNSQDQDAIGPNKETDARSGKAQLTAVKLSSINSEGTATDIDSADDLDTANVVAEIANNSGAELPGTGGIGTTLFYLGGGAMVAVAGVYLISKKRMNNAEEK